MRNLFKKIVVSICIFSNYSANAFQPHPLLQAGIGLGTIAGTFLVSYMLYQNAKHASMQAIPLEACLATFQEEIALAKVYITDYEMYECEKSNFDTVVHSRFMHYPYPVQQYARELFELITEFDSYYEILIFKKSQSKDLSEIQYLDSCARDSALARRKIVMWLKIILNSPLYKDSGEKAWKYLAIGALSFIAGFSLGDYLEENKC